MTVKILVQYPPDKSSKSSNTETDRNTIIRADLVVPLHYRLYLFYDASVL